MGTEKCIRGLRYLSKIIFDDQAQSPTKAPLWLKFISMSDKFVIFCLGSFYIIFEIWCSDSRYCTLSVQMQCNILSTSISSAIQGTFWWKFIWCSSVKSIKWNSNALFIYLWKIDRPFLLICSYSGKHPIFSYTRTNNVTQKTN